MVTELAERVQRQRYFAIVDEVDNILIDEARTPLIISGQAEESGDLYYTFARLVAAAEGAPGGRRGGRRLLHRPQGARGLAHRRGHREDREAARRARHLRRQRRSAAGAPFRAGAPGARAVQARPRLHRQGRRDRHRRRVHRPPDARPSLVRGPPPGGRGQGGPARPARVGDPGHDHLPELLPALRQAGGHDRYGHDRAGGVLQDLRPRGGGHPDPPADGPRGRGGPRLPQRERQVQRAHRRRSSRCPRPGRPVLVGTVSVEKSEVLSEMLKRRGVKHEVLNAKFHEKEAPIVAQAGRAGRRDHRHQHGRPRHGHQARRRRQRPGLGGAPPAGHQPGRGGARRLRGGARARRKAETAGRARAGGRGGRPAHHRHRAPRRSPHRQPASRPRRPPGRPGFVALLPVPRGHAHEALRVGPGDRR